MASTRLNFVLDGRDSLSPVLDRAGDNTTRLERRIAAATSGMGRAFARFTRNAEQDTRQLDRSMAASTVAVAAFQRDADGRLRDLRGRFVSASAAASHLRHEVDQLQGPMRGAAAATGEASAAGGALGPVLGAVAVGVGASLLPALGALVPMMAGAALAAGTLKLGFAGVSDAMELAGTDHKEYAKALKKMSPESRAFTKELVSLKKEFSGLGKDIQKVMLPGFTRALKDARPVIDIVGKGMVQLGKGFGEAATGAGRLFKSGGFQADLRTNLDLGMSFVRELSGGFGSLLRGLLTFGAKSKPTLDAFAGGLSGLLGKGGGGLVGMFKGLEVGIEGSSKFLDGFFSMINQVLPALGRFAGEASRSLGPLLGEGFKLAGDEAASAFDVLGGVLKGLSPVFEDLGYGLRATRDIFAVMAPTIRDVGTAIAGSLLPSFAEIDKGRGPLQKLSDSIEANKGTIQEVARIAGNAFVDIAAAAIEHLPAVVGVFKIASAGIVGSLGGILHGAASAFGWIPGIGGKLKQADKDFGTFKSSFISGLSEAEKQAATFSANALPKLEAGRLKLDINNWNSQIETAKAKLKTVPPSKQAALRAEISDLRNKVAEAQGKLAAFNGTTSTAYITVQTRYATPTPGPYAGKYVFGKADGGLIKGYADGGGPVRGPGTSTSDSILARLSNNEYVVKAKSVAKYGVAFMNALNDGRLSMSSGLGGGASMAGAGQEVGRGLSAGMRASADGVDAAARQMAAAATAGVRAELEIASPSKKMIALAKDTGKGLIVGLTGSKAKISATAKDLVADIWAAWKGTKSTKDSRLVTMVNRDTAKLQSLATKRDSIASRIAAARAYSAELKTSAREGAKLSSLGIPDEEVTAGSIQAGLQQKLSKLRTFTSYINTLAKRGLSKGLLRQVLDMGPDQGYAYASALAGASTSVLKGINATQLGLDRATTTLGNLGADLMYDSGKNAGRGYLAGLTSQQAAIEKQMLTIARGMDKAIRKELGIKSPSTVAAKSGAHFTQGLGVGALQQIPFLDRAMTKVTGRMAAARPVAGRPAVTAGGTAGGQQAINLHVTFSGVIDRIGAAKEIQKLLAELAMTTGQPIRLGVSA